MFIHERYETFRNALTAAASDGLQRRLYIASIFVALLLVALAFRSVLETQKIIHQAMREELSSQTNATGFRIREALSLADFTAKQARKQWLKDGQLKTHDDYVEDFPNYKGLISQVAIIGHDGKLAASSLNPQVAPTYLGDRKHFLIHTNSTNDKIFISEPVIGRESKIRSVQFTRPIHSEQQEFAGVVVISLSPDYIEKVLFNPNQKRDLTFVLLGTDGIPRVDRSPQSATDTIVSEKPAALISQAAAQQDSQWYETHYWNTLQLDEYGLLLKVGISKDIADKQIYQAVGVAAGATLVMLLMLIYYADQMLRLVRSRNGILQKLEDSKIKASSANAMKSRFVAGISHELRTPLNGILGFSELIGMSNDFDEAKRYGKIVNKSAEHLHQLVNTLLDLAKIEAGQMETTRIYTDVRELCDSVVNIHRYSMEKKGIVLDIQYESDIPKIIYTDHIKMMQILNNVLSNAVKFTDEGAVFFSVSIERGKWSFSVADTGIGMSPAQLKNIFTRFNNIKLAQVESADRPGAGLGMALCKELVELLGGTIEIYSEPMVGTVVKVLLPQIDENT